jgi:hypothetical protein
MLRVGFSTTDSFVSKTIRWFTQSEVSHTFVLYYDPAFQQTMVVEADWTGFRIIPLERFEKSNRIVEIREIPVDEDPALSATAFMLGSPYDFKGLLGHALARVASVVLRRKVNTPFRSSRKIICSEAVVRILQVISYPDAEKLIPDAVSPQDLLDFLRLAP